jgi:hypothetical protein
MYVNAKHQSGILLENGGFLKAASKSDSHESMALESDVMGCHVRKRRSIRDRRGSREAKPFNQLHLGLHSALQSHSGKGGKERSLSPQKNTLGDHDGGKKKEINFLCYTNF